MRVRHGTALLLRLLAPAALVLGLQAAPAHSSPAAGTFRVLAFYDGTYDAAHISFDREANTWFAQQLDLLRQCEPALDRPGLTGRPVGPPSG